jgi:hypothetical protein
MPIDAERKKIVERWMLTAARRAGVPIPRGEIPFETPDFRFGDEANGLGIEVSEVLRPANSDGEITPVEEESFHEKVIRIAQAEYYRQPDAKPARLVVYFARSAGKRRNKYDMARSLAEFVRINLHRANPVISFAGIELPDGFGSMSIASESGDWWSGECGGVNLTEIPKLLASRINAKSSRVSKYRANLPKGASVWLLLYSSVGVARGVPIPHGLADFRARSNFDRIFWFDALRNEVAEIRQ